VELSTLYKDKNSMDVVVEPTLFKDRTAVKARYWLETPAPGKVRRIFEGSIKVDMPLVGRKVEQFIIEDMTRAYQITADVTTEWLKKPETTS